MEDDVHQRDLWGVSRYPVGWNSYQVAAWHVQSLVACVLLIASDPSCVNVAGVV